MLRLWLQPVLSDGQPPAIKQACALDSKGRGLVPLLAQAGARFLN